MAVLVAEVRDVDRGHRVCGFHQKNGAGRKAGEAFAGLQYRQRTGEAAAIQSMGGVAVEFVHS